MAACYRRQEGEKQRAYEQRVRAVERGSFTPFIFSMSREMGRAATVAYKRLASFLSVKLTALSWVGSDATYHSPC